MPTSLNAEAFRAQYEAAVMRTRIEATRELTREAAALSQQIRWNPERLAEFAYPLGMDLATTCCCHICVDDANISDEHVAYCIQQAAKNEHPDCLRLALLLARASFTQRRKIARLAWDDLASIGRPEQA